MSFVRRLSMTALAMQLAAIVATPAFAALNRVWVSGKGVDAPTCGTPSAPCRSFQYVHDNIVAAGGEIDVLDPAGYGAVTITKSLSIVNDGIGLAGVQQTVAGQDAIKIEASNTDIIQLRGLTIDGLGVARNGVYIGRAASVEIVGCTFRRANSSGIAAAPDSNLELFITDVLASDNRLSGIAIGPPSPGSVKGLVKRASLNNNDTGFSMAANGFKSSAVTVVDSSAAGNTTAGFWAGTAISGVNATVMLDRIVSTANGFGVRATFGATLRMARSTVTRNEKGIEDNSIVETFGDNVILGNTVDVPPSATLLAVPLK